jgi:hypothetical protein
MGLRNTSSVFGEFKKKSQCGGGCAEAHGGDGARWPPATSSLPAPGPGPKTKTQNPGARGIGSAAYCMLHVVYCLLPVAILPIAYCLLYVVFCGWLLSA